MGKRMGRGWGMGGNERREGGREGGRRVYSGSMGERGGEKEKENRGKGNSFLISS